MRSLVPIAVALLLCGCVHTRKSSDTLAGEAKHLEELVEVLREENQSLIRQLQTEPRETRCSAVVERRREAATRARQTYSLKSRVDDLNAMVRILERQKKALALEQDAWSDNRIEGCTFPASPQEHGSR